MKFIITFLGYLEPINFKRGQIILNELDSVNQLYMFTESCIDVGYDINRQIKYKIRFRGSLIIGGFECSFHRRSQQIYKAQMESTGYMIRKRNWKKVQDQFPEFYYQMRNKCLCFYISKIRKPINQQKIIDIQKYTKRADYK